jgi:hypothetical protein
VITGPTIAATDVIRPFLPTPEPFNPGINNPTAAALQRDAELPPLVLSGAGSGTEAIQITAQDGTMLAGDLYPSLSGERVAGILLIAPDRTAWGDFALRLQARDYTVLSMDMRDPPMLGDFISMLNALANAGTVDPGRIVVVASEAGADLALVGCAGDLLCDALAMISPADVRGVGYLESFLPRPLMVAAAQDDGNFAVAEAIRDSAPSQITLESVGGSGSGAGLVVSSSALADSVIRFLSGVFVG